MSVNITVNGNFGKHCRSHPLLQDPQEERKLEEKERRKMRLLQVREECKKLAKKIREEVNEEQKKELQKLQATKEKEFECWRQYELQRKGEGYRAAIFQIGTAHQAARRENEEKKSKQRGQGSYKDFQKQMAARKCQTGKVQFSCESFCPCQQSIPGTDKHFKCTCTKSDAQSKHNKDEESQKRKREYIVSSSESEYEDEGYKEETKQQPSSFSLSSTSDSSSSCLCTPDKNIYLMKTPAVYLDVEVGSDDSVSISAPAEVNDKHAEYNRQFSRVIRVSPRKVQKENTCENPSIQASSTSTTLSSDVTAKDGNENKLYLEKSKYNQLKNTEVSKEKRFTIISDLVKKQQENVSRAVASSYGPSTSKTTSATATPHLSPRKQRDVSIRPPVERTPPQSPRKAGVTSKSSSAPRQIANKPDTSCPPNTLASSATAAPHLPLRKQPREMSIRPPVVRTSSQSPRKTSVTSKSSAAVVVRTSTQSPRKTSAKSKSSVPKEIANKPDTSCPPPPNSLASSATAAPRLPLRKQPREISNPAPVKRTPSQSPRKTSATTKSISTSTTQPSTTFKATTKSNTAVITDGNSSGRVQFYDYNSKLAKEKNQSVTSVSVQRQRDQSQPSAMEQAELEKQRERERQLEALKKCQLMEERCEKALEREQIRRDCNELSEKLDVLTREYANQLPTNDNQHHIFADKQLRKEGKMNSAIEKLLQRPNIITCSEQDKPTTDDDKHKSATKVNLLNVASLNNKPLPADDASSDSCCSILLGYVDDQSKLIKQDLQNNGTTQDQSKPKRLKNLLKRLDQLRKSLLEELRNENKSKATKNGKEKKDNLRQAIDGISEVCKEHEEILIHDKGQKTKSLRAKAKQFPTRESLLDRKVRELYEQQNKSQNPKERKDLKDTVRKEDSDKDDSSSLSDNIDLINSNDKENEICTSVENPLEIIITVRGETKCVKIPQKHKRKISFKKNPSKLSTLIRSPQPSPSVTKKHTPKKKPQAVKGNSGVSMSQGHNSCDSNSTSYRSLPPEIPTKIDDLSKLISNEEKEDITSTQDSEISLESSNNTPMQSPHHYVNPLIAQYVNRLLGMTHTAVHRLGVSSSDIETPSSSIINITANVKNSEILHLDERLEAINYFIEENKSFIKELEQSVTLQNNVSLENSLKMLDEIWRKRLKRNTAEVVECKKSQKVKEKVQTAKLSKTGKIDEKSLSKHKEKKASKNNNVQQNTRTQPRNNKQKDPKTASTDNLTKDMSKSLSSHYSTADNESVTLKLSKRPAKTVDKAIDAKLPNDASKREPDSQIARYAKLTENCTHRIAELTELINRVREEKQRLLEVTLSSVSDTGRHSTEYLEEHENKSKTRIGKDDITLVSSSSEEITLNKQSLYSGTLQEMPKLSSADKNKQIANSCDSGIAESRPITALENRIEQEPLPQTTENTSHQPARKMKPPPTLKRFSPQLPEEELAHELSTIFEVDTPATSRINTDAGQLAEERENTFCNGLLQQPVKFPTFEQYVKKLNLNVTQMDPEQSIKLQKEFTTFLECLQQKHENSLKPSECPSKQNVGEDEPYLEETMEECLTRMGITSISPRTFPALREYIRGNTSKSSPSDEQQHLDTASLEDITDGQTRTNTENDTGSVDFENELKNRKIIKNSFRVVETEKYVKDTAFYQEILPAESGLEKLSTSGNTSDLLDSELKRMVQKFSGRCKKKSKNIKVVSSATTSTNDSSALANSALRAASLEDSIKGCGSAFNLRDFLTRELEKLANNSSSYTNTSSDESLCSQLLHTLLDTLTPRTIGTASKSGRQTLDRQKTSTPVAMQSSQSHSSASTGSNSISLLFSGESHLSSVHYHDCSQRLVNNEENDVDQS